MITVDDRTPEQKKTHYWAVVGRDKFMSGWGEAKGGYSRAAWACPTLKDAEGIEDRIKDRSDMQYVNLVDLRTYRPPRDTAHFHIYVERNL
jgi:hypothetical protein